MPLAASVDTGRPPGDAAAHARRNALAYRRLVTAAALLLSAGLVVAAATGWDWWSRVHRIEVSQARLAQRVDAAWTGQGARAGAALPVQAGAAQVAPAEIARAPDALAGGAPAEGAPVARLYLPRVHRTLVVIEGVTDADLLRGPGHIPGTAQFGHPGNAGIAGHRYPGVFWDLDRLRAGDQVVVETADRWYVYRVVGSLVVQPDDTRVLAPRPAGAPPGVDQFLTLVTCDPKFTTEHRLIRQAALVRVQPRGGVPPIELKQDR